jgi:hypothetical protein
MAWVRRTVVAFHDSLNSSFENLYQVITLVNRRVRQRVAVQVLHDLLRDD